MHFWSKFGKPHFIWYWFIVRTNSQAQNGVNFDFKVQFNLEGQGQWTPKTIGILIKVFCTSGPNLVIVAWAGDKLSSGQTDDWRTHTHTYTHTHRQTQATTIPEGHNWPRVKRCDRRTNRQTDGRTDWTIHRAAWSQLKIPHGSSCRGI